MTASLSLAVFFQQSRDWRPSSVETASRALIREGCDVAATLTPDPLRGDPMSPEVQRVASVACLHRATAAEPEPDAPDTVPVLAPGERTPAQVRDRAGMAGTVLVLAAVVGCALGVLLAWLGGVL